MKYKCLLGSSGLVDASYARGNYRLRSNPSNRDYRLGFRLVRRQ